MLTVDTMTTWQAVTPVAVPLVLLTAEPWAVVKARWDECRNVQAAEWQTRNIRNNVLREVRRYMKRAGIGTQHPMTVHTIRKSCGHNHADAGTPIHVHQKRMGHASIGTTCECSRSLRGQAAFLLAPAGGRKDFPLTQRGFDRAA